MKVIAITISITVDAVLHRLHAEPTPLAQLQGGLSLRLIERARPTADVFSILGNCQNARVLSFASFAHCVAYSCVRHEVESTASITSTEHHPHARANE